MLTILFCLNELPYKYTSVDLFISYKTKIRVNIKRKIGIIILAFFIGMKCKILRVSLNDLTGITYFLFYKMFRLIYTRQIKIIKKPHCN